MILSLFQNVFTNTGAGGHALSVIAAYGQMILATILALSVFFRVMKRDSLIQSIFLSIAPICIILAIAIVEPLFMSSFLGGSYYDFPFLEAILLEKQFYLEVIVLVLSYIAVGLLTKWYIRLKKLVISPAVKLFETLSMVVEVVSVVALLAITVLYFTGDSGAFARLHLWLIQHDTLLLWLVFGMYTIAYKMLLSLFSIGWSALFGNWEVHPTQSQLEQESEKVLIKLIRTKNAYGWQGWLIFTVFYYFAVPFRAVHDASITKGFYVMILLPMVFLIGATIIGFLPWLFPKRTKVYKKFLNWSPTEHYMQQFCYEYFSAQLMQKDENTLYTKSFAISKAPFDVNFRNY